MALSPQEKCSIARTNIVVLAIDPSIATTSPCRRQTAKDPDNIYFHSIARTKVLAISFMSLLYSLWENLPRTILARKCGAMFELYSEDICNKCPHYTLKYPRYIILAGAKFFAPKMCCVCGHIARTKCPCYRG